MLVALYLGFIFTMSLYLWKIADRLRERITLKFSGQQSFKSVNADAVARLVIFLLLMAPVLGYTASWKKLPDEKQKDLL